MRYATLILASACILLELGLRSAAGQTQPFSPPTPGEGGSGAQTIDGVAVRIEDDILTESEVRELAAFQKLVDGRAKDRGDLIRELADQWIVRGEANAAKFPHPSHEDVDRAYAQLAKQFPSPEDFRARCAAAGLTEAAVRRMLEQQLYLSRFIDFRFRPAAQVDDKQVESYYRDEFAPQLEARGQEVPPLESVADTIREVLIQRAIDDRATKWLDETRERLKIDVEPPGASS
jgi:hypothetical protein